MITPSGLALTLRLIGSAPKLYQKLRQWSGRPGKEEREQVVRYCRRIDERRVFSAPFHDEVVESCIGSLNQVKEWTDEALSQAKHHGVRAALGAILDQVRRFLDKWHDHRTHSVEWDRHWNPGARGARPHAFFEDLGELRGKIKVLVRMLIELVPDASAPALLGSGG